MNFVSIIRYGARRSFATAVSPPAAKGKKKAGKLGAGTERRVFPVETDAKKLAKFVCGSNIMKEGDDIELKPDSEYPDWLWKLNTGKPPPIEEMDQNTKEYWYRVRKLNMVNNNKMGKLKKF